MKPPRQLQLPVQLPERPSCGTCHGSRLVGHLVQLPSGQRSARLEPCPDCEGPREEDPAAWKRPPQEDPT